jgi:hypothetical protein
MLGIHPNQIEMERRYDRLIKTSYVLLLFCRKIRASLPKALESASVQALLRQYEHECRPMSNATPNSLQQLAVRVPELAAKLVESCVTADPRVRPEQLQHEFDRLKVWNSSMSNAMLMTKILFEFRGGEVSISHQVIHQKNSNSSSTSASGPFVKS